MFKSCYNRGFQMTFKNDLTISVQFGTGNYCERRNYTSSYKDDLSHDMVESPDAEIAIWNKEGKWFDFGTDQVKGWVDADEVALWINKVANAKSIKTIKRVK